MPTAACGRRNIARRISYISRYTHQDTKSCTSSITLSFTRLPSTTVGFGRYRKAFRWGTPRPRLRNVLVTYEQFARGWPTRKSRIASSSSGESIAVHRRSNIALRSEIVHRLHPSTYHNELSGAVWSTMLEAGSTARQDEVLDNRIIFSRERLLSFYFPV
jgi:hypothetical protein